MTLAAQQVVDRVGQIVEAGHVIEIRRTLLRLHTLSAPDQDGFGICGSSRLDITQAVADDRDILETGSKPQADRPQQTRSGFTAFALRFGGVRTKKDAVDMPAYPRQSIAKLCVYSV